MSDVVVPAPPKKIWVGFDLGGTKMQVVICDESFKPLLRKKKKTRGTDGAKSGP